MKNVLAFLTSLSENNNKEWFDAHRAQWKQVQAEFNTFAQQLIDGVAAFDPSVSGLTIKDCTYRLNRDTRFSPDKTPYKTHVGVFIAPKGKKSGYAGYYFHLEPHGGRLAGYSLMAVGVHCPEPVILKSIREEIVDHGTDLVQAIAQSNGFTLNTDEPKLKRTPKGFPTDTEFDEILKLKNISIEKPIEQATLQSSDILEQTIAEFKTTLPFIQMINRAIHFAYEEMM
jgi:uncharacterized protein (TIGR02453 family)